MKEKLDAFEAMKEDADAIVCDMVYPECGMCPILERCLKKRVEMKNETKG